METKTRISIIFVNYQSSRYLRGAFESLFSLEPETDFFEVIVANNDVSEYDSLRDLQQAFPFSIIETGGNVGFGHANNAGADRARGEILAFINPDVLWTGTCLRKIAGFLDENRKVGVLGMAILDENNRPEAWSAGFEPSLATLLWNNVFPFRRSFHEEKGPSFFDWVSGGALFVRRDLFFEIGGFDDRFFLYFEDVDLCTEARKHGVFVARHAGFPVIHLGSKSHASARLQKKHFYDSQQKYFDKHRPKWEGTILSWLQSVFCHT